LVFIPRVKGCTLIKVSSSTLEPWPGKPPLLRVLVSELKAVARRNGGYCKTRFADNALLMEFRGVSAEWVSHLAAQWRKVIRSRREPTKIEQFNDMALPRRAVTPGAAGQGACPLPAPSQRRQRGSAAAVPLQ
jgi:hypothetical protein